MMICKNCGQRLKYSPLDEWVHLDGRITRWHIYGQYQEHSRADHAEPVEVTKEEYRLLFGGERPK